MAPKVAKTPTAEEKKLLEEVELEKKMKKAAGQAGNTAKSEVVKTQEANLEDNTEGGQAVGSAVKGFAPPQ